MRTTIYSLIIYITIFVFWAAGSMFVDLNEAFLPDIQSLYQVLKSTNFYTALFIHLGITFSRVLFGLAIAILVGIPLGLALSKNSIARSVLEPFLDFLRGIPISMLFPLFIVFVGFGELSRSLIVITLALPIMATSVLVASNPTPDNQERKSYFKLRSNLLSGDTKLRMDLWEALPGIITGLRLSLSLGLVVVIVTEMFFTANGGIGWLAYEAYENFAIDEMYLLIIIAGLVSLGMNFAVKLVENRIN